MSTLQPAATALDFPRATLRCFGGVGAFGWSVVLAIEVLALAGGGGAWRGFAASILMLVLVPTWWITLLGSLATIGGGGLRPGA